MSTDLPVSADPPDITRGPMLVAVSISLTLLALVTVALRLFARRRILRFSGADDYVMIGTMTLSLFCMANSILQVAYGVGRHTIYVSAATKETGLMINYIGQTFFLWAPCGVKVSVALFLIRLTPDVTLRRTLQIAMIFIVVWTFACFITILTQCKNVAVLWNPTIKTTCFSVTTIQALGWASAAVSIGSDIFFALMPTAMLWKLQINKRRKWSLVGVMSLGVFASGAAIVKTIYIANYSSNADILWNVTDLTMWTTVELNVGIIAASLPCLWPFVKALREGTTSLSRNKQYHMQPYPSSSRQSRASRAPTRASQYLQPRTVTRITGGGRTPDIMEDKNSSEERMVSTTRDANIDMTTEKITAYSVNSEATT